MKVYIVGLFLVLLPFLGFAQDTLTEYTEEGRSESTDSVQQRQDIIQDATEKVSNRLIRELIGDARFDRQINTIKTKIIGQSDKYIPFIKTGEPRTDSNRTRMNVTLKVSQKSLVSLLQQSGLMSTQEGSPSLLPAVTFTDLVNHKSLSWWINIGSSDDAGAFLKTQERVFFESLKTNFLKFGFQVQDPLKAQAKKTLPPNLQVEGLRTQDYLMMGELLKSQLVLKGDVKIESGKVSQSYKILTRFTVLHSGNGRVVADSLRNVETDSGPFAIVVPKKMAMLFEDINQDLATQFNEAWTRGTLGANLIRLVIKGVFDYKNLESVKEDIKTQVRAVHSLSERLFVGNQIEFDVDIEGGIEALSKSLGQVKWRTIQLRVDSVDANRIVLK